MSLTKLFGVGGMQNLSSQLEAYCCGKWGNFKSAKTTCSSDSDTPEFRQTSRYILYLKLPTQRRAKLLDKTTEMQENMWVRSHESRMCEGASHAT